MAASKYSLLYLFSVICLLGGISLILYPLINLSLNEAFTKKVHEHMDNVDLEAFPEHMSFLQFTREYTGRRVVNLPQSSIDPSVPKIMKYQRNIVKLRHSTKTLSEPKRRKSQWPTALISGKDGAAYNYLTASSSYDKGMGPECSRMFFVDRTLCYWAGWASKKTSEDSAPWIQVDLRHIHVIVAVHTKGRFRPRQWVSRFLIKTSDTGSDNSFQQYTVRGTKQEFVGNSISHTRKVNNFKPPLVTRFVRLCVLKYEYHPTLMWELFGYKRELN